MESIKNTGEEKQFLEKLKKLLPDIASGKMAMPDSLPTKTIVPETTIAPKEVSNDKEINADKGKDLQ